WLIAVGIVIVGGLIRHVFNAHHRGELDSGAQAAIPLALMLLVGLALLTGYRPDLATAGNVAFSDVSPIIQKHCVACHAVRPTNADFPEAPKGVMLEVPGDIKRHAPMINQQVVLSDIMPLGNETGMTDEERALIAGWVASGAPISQ
ncbi:MAG: urate hydroxylase PuuD, partial [Alphaproteobacteria bacterium]